MTSAAQLLGWISLVLLTQLVLGVAGALWRVRRAARVAPDAPSHAGAGPSRTPAAWPGWRVFRVLRRAYEDDSDSQCSFYLQPLDGEALPPFKPGQFLSFSLDLPQPGGGVRKLTRCYSLSDAPDPAQYRVTIKRVPAPCEPAGLPPGLASQHFHDRVQVGSLLRVKAPAGQFFIDPEDDTPAVLIAGGIGITPLLCMLKTCLLRKPQRALHLFYGVRNGSEQAFRPALQQLAAQHPALRLTVAYSRPAEHERQGRDYQHRGHLDVALLQRSLGAGRHLYYLCGPAAMMQSLVPALLASGVPQQDLRYEAFGPATVPAAAVTAASASASTRSEPLELRFQRSGRTLLWDGRDASLLDFAERQGVALESACRSGGCGTCETRVLQGEVVYAQRPMHEIAPGHCLLCVGRPATALVLEA
ncbi:2Fe-2S iron-sulfur cluster-binding protein [Inhella sp.]|uniref:2Fe-2S iron-sulfur cluster-binding protein n=1 Tax=Inhella sp. TaxID=1921806 RepID=UPI0035AFAAD6